MQSSILQGFSSSRADPLDWKCDLCYVPNCFLFPNVYMYIIFVVLVVVCILFCVVQQKRRSRDENRHHGKGRMDEISVLSLLSSYLR